MLRKEDFVNNELPRLFKAMNLLNVTMEDLRSYHQQYLNQDNGLNGGA
jgi:GntR family transcriptional regulator